MLIKGNFSFVPFLFQNAKDNDGDTPLHLASIKGNEEISFRLIEKGADPNIQSKKGLTPLILRLTSAT